MDVEVVVITKYEENTEKSALLDDYLINKMNENDIFFNVLSWKKKLNTDNKRCLSNLEEETISLLVSLYMKKREDCNEVHVLIVSQKKSI